MRGGSLTGREQEWILSVLTPLVAPCLLTHGNYQSLVMRDVGLGITQLR